MDKKKITVRVLIYLAGMVVLALGLSLNSRVSLGVSPIVSIGFVFSCLTPVNYGDATFVLYCVLVLIQVIIHVCRKNYRAIIPTLLQIVLSLVFTRFMNLFVRLIPDFAVDLAGTWMGSLPGRILFLLFAIVLTGTGAATTLNMQLIPNPGDGIVQTVADAIKKSTGFAKNCVDVAGVIVSVLCSLLRGGRIYGVGIGTLCGMLLTGRVIALFNHFARQPMKKAAGLDVS